MSRQLWIASVNDYSGFLIAELISTDPSFAQKNRFHHGPVAPSRAESCKALTKVGEKIVPHKPGRLKDVFQTLGALERMRYVAHQVNSDIPVKLIEAAKKAVISNVCWVSSAGCDLAERDKQPLLREFIDLLDFYAENLFLYSKQAQEKGSLPLPIGSTHNIAPIALGDVAAHVLMGKGKHGFSDQHRGQLMALTGKTRN
ncbi:hypothetical protein BJX96DRAFT_174783 [Aspergillus floccosus]